jgi:L-threonylcarbamoyladenylate synthase
MIFNKVGLEPNKIESQTSIYKVKASGLLKSHYAPSAKVFLLQDARPGDGFIALSNIATPHGAIRLASPKNNQEYAQVLYRALNLADSKQLSRVIVIPPEGDDIALAILDRLQRCEYQAP